MVAFLPKRILLLTGRVCAIALGCVIPLSVVLDNLLLVVLLALMLVGHGRTILQTAVGNPVARASILLFVLLLLGMAYGDTPLQAAAGILGKYADLAFVPLLMVILLDERTRYRALAGFLAVMLATALLSWLVGLHMLPVSKWMWTYTADNPAIFRSSITQNILMAFAAFLFGLKARDSRNRNARWALAIAALLAGGSVLFMVQGRTGYLVMLALMVYLGYMTVARRLQRHGRHIGWRETAGIGVLALVVVASAYQLSPRLHGRVDQVVTEYQAWRPDVNSVTSTGERLEFYYNTLMLVRQHPLFGVGTGGFAAAYAKQVQGTGITPTHNPHNEYLLVTVQVGLPGLLLLLYLFYTQWRTASRLPGLFERDAARGLVLAIAISCLFNSPLLDHTEGLFAAFMSALLFAGLGTGKRNG
ncbi:MAG: hypothetical protein GC139_07970 [Sideroxydans sp.]|nr:hypothetical protein [Sideroxydans sp.]